MFRLKNRGVLKEKGQGVLTTLMSGLFEIFRCKFLPQDKFYKGKKSDPPTRPKITHLRKNLGNTLAQKITSKIEIKNFLMRL